MRTLNSNRKATDLNNDYMDNYLNFKYVIKVVSSIYGSHNSNVIHLIMVMQLVNHSSDTLVLACSLQQLLHH